MRFNHLLILACCFLLASCATQLQSKQAKISMLYQVAETVDAAQQPKTALRVYKQLVKLEPENAELLLKIANNYSAINDSLEALHYYHQYLAANPGSLEAKLGLAKTAVLLDKPQLAIAQLEPLAKEHEEIPALFNLLGIAEDLQGHYAKAQEYYRQGLNIEPRNILINNNLALSLALSGERKAATKIIQTVPFGRDLTGRVKNNLTLLENSSIKTTQIKAALEKNHYGI